MRPISKSLLIPLIFLLFSCTNTNQFADKISREIYSLADERRTNELIRLFYQVDEDHQIQIATVFSSFQDSVSMAFLKKIVRSEESEIRKAAVFSLGQYRQTHLVKDLAAIFTRENSTSVKEQLIIAIGKCEGDSWLNMQSSIAEEDLHLSFAQAFYYASIKKKTTLQSIKSLVKLFASDDEDVLFYALSALSRSSVGLTAYSGQLMSVRDKCKEVSTFSAWVSCISKTGVSGFSQLLKILNGDENYLSKLSVLKGADNYAADSGAVIVRKALQDKHFHVREQAATWISSHPANFSSKELIHYAQKENHLKTKYLLFYSALSVASPQAAASISPKIIAEYEKEKDEYVQGFQLKALAGSFANMAFIEEETFSTPSILVREYGMEALLNIRGDKRFSIFASQWKEKNPEAMPLDDYFAELIKNAIETWDVSLVSMASVFLRDTSLKVRAPGRIPIPYVSVEFMRDALKRMKLPRDIEPYAEMLKTLCFYENKIVSGNLKPEFNNPIDWDLVNRIPDDQEIMISTSEGDIELELFVDKAPGTVSQFIKLIKQGFYNKKRLHRVVPGFVIQDGCPRGDGYGSIMETIRSEFNPAMEFTEGTIGMANAGDDTESCQWFITHTRTPRLNGRYTAFGRVTKGMDVVHKLNMGAHIKFISLKP